jgi:hypothetical protein
LRLCFCESFSLLQALVDVVEFCVSQLPTGRTDDFFQLRRPADANDRRSHFRATQYPRDSQLGEVSSVFTRNFPETFRKLKIGCKQRLTELRVTATVIVWWELRYSFARHPAREQAFLHRTVNHNAYSLGGAER